MVAEEIMEVVEAEDIVATKEVVMVAEKVKKALRPEVNYF